MYTGITLLALIAYALLWLHGGGMPTAHAAADGLADALGNGTRQAGLGKRPILVLDPGSDAVDCQPEHLRGKGDGHAGVGDQVSFCLIYGACVCWPQVSDPFA